MGCRVSMPPRNEYCGVCRGDVLDHHSVGVSVTGERNPRLVLLTLCGNELIKQGEGTVAKHSSASAQ